LPSAEGSEKHPAIVLVQDTLTIGTEAEKLAADGNVVAVVSLSGVNADPGRPVSGNWMNNTRAWLVGRNLPAIRAAEISAAVSDVAKRADVDPSRISARATGIAGVPLLLAAATNPQIGSVLLERTPHSLRAAIDAPIHGNLHDAVIPGFAVKWDLADLRDLLRPRSVTWKDPTDWMGNIVPLAGGYTYSPSDPNVLR
jgi:hypothetical protein